MADDEFDIFESDGSNQVSDISSLFGDDAPALGVDEQSGENVNEYNDEQFLQQQEEADAVAQVAFGKSMAFDYESGEFILKGGDPITVTELDTFREWVQLSLSTQRRLYIALDEDFGIDLERVFSDTMSEGEVRAFLAKEIEEALAVHDRFESMQDFDLRKVDGTLYVVFSINTSAGRVDLATTLGA